MAPSTIWWLLAGAAVALELLTGTFYLLMLAVGMAAAAMAAHLGVGMVAQLLTAAGIGGGAVVVWHQLRKKKASDPSARAMRSVNLDVGERGCKNFCVNGLLAGNCHLAWSNDDRREESVTHRTHRRAAGELQEA